MNFPSIPQLKLFLKQTFFAGLAISLTVYTWLRLIFFEVPFSISEDGSIVLKTILAGWTTIILLKASFHILLFGVEKIGSLISKS